MAQHSLLALRNTSQHFITTLSGFLNSEITNKKIQKCKKKKKRGWGIKRPKKRILTYSMRDETRLSIPLFHFSWEHACWEAQTFHCSSLVCKSPVTIDFGGYK